MFKNLVALVALTLASSGAVAADLPSRAAPVPPRPEKPAYVWTGFYGLASFGAGMDRRAANLDFDTYSYSAGDVFYNAGATGNYVGNARSIPNGQLAPPAGYQTLISHSYKLDTSWAYFLGTSPASTGYQAATYPLAPTRVLEGRKIFGFGALEFGYQRQIGSLVVGMGLDFGLLTRERAESWSSSGSYSGSSGLIGDSSVVCAAPRGCTISGTSEASGRVAATTNWLSTLRGRVGWADDRLLVFASGGLAMGRVAMSSSADWRDSNSKCLLGYVPGACGAEPASWTATEGTTAHWSGRRSLDKFGYVVGGGVAYGLSDSVFVNMEALYYDLGKASLSVQGTGATNCSGNTNDFLCGGSSGAAPHDVRVANQTITKTIDGTLLRVGLGVKF